MGSSGKDTLFAYLSDGSTSCIPLSLMVWMRSINVVELIHEDGLDTTAYRGGHQAEGEERSSDKHHASS